MSDQLDPFELQRGECVFAAALQDHSSGNFEKPEPIDRIINTLNDAITERRCGSVICPYFDRCEKLATLALKAHLTKPNS